MKATNLENSTPQKGRFKSMKLLLPLAFVLIMALVSGCTSDPVQKDLLSYNNDQLVPFKDEEYSIVGAYINEVGDNYTSDEDLYATLEEILPKYRSLIDKLENIRPETPEVKELNEMLIGYSNKNYNAMTQVLSAIENQDSSVIAYANEKLEEVRKDALEWRDKLEQLKKDHSVETEE